MKTVLECLRRSLADKSDVDARGTLLLNSALALSGINDLGREGEFAPYPLQSFAQRYLGLDYPHALTGLFLYWLKEIYRASKNKAVFHRYFSEILSITSSASPSATASWRLTRRTMEGWWRSSTPSAPCPARSCR